MIHPRMFVHSYCGISWQLVSYSNIFMYGDPSATVLVFQHPWQKIKTPENIQGGLIAGTSSWRGYQGEYAPILLCSPNIGTVINRYLQELSSEYTLFNNPEFFYVCTHRCWSKDILLYIISRGVMHMVSPSDWTVYSEVQYIGLLPGMVCSKSSQTVATPWNLRTTSMTLMNV